MAAPSAHNTRVDPSSATVIPLRDGHPTKITFKADTNIEFWEKTVTPPGIDGGDAVDGTTMFNTTWRVQRPRTLKTLTEASLTAAYDPVLYTSIVTAINREDEVTVTFPDGSQVTFWGYLKSFTPNEHVEGEQPTAEVMIVPTNWDTTNQAEGGPLVTTVGSV